MRFFRASQVVYEQVRSALDAAWGLPNAVGTKTCIEPAASAPRDPQGRVLVGVDNEFCEYAEAAAILPDLLASGAVEEITAAEYQAALPQTP